jgi:hypothetical protein
MVQKNINKQIAKGTYYLKFYDEHGDFPFNKKRIDITISKEAIIILNKHKNKSKVIEELIMKNDKTM